MYVGMFFIYYSVFALLYFGIWIVTNTDIYYNEYYSAPVPHTLIKFMFIM